jgi:hypothetical protein
VGAITIWGIVEIGEFKAHRLLVARPQNNLNASMTAVFPSSFSPTSAVSAGLQRELKCILARAEQAKVLDPNFRNMHRFLPPPRRNISLKRNIHNQK